MPRTKCKNVPDKKCQDVPINVPRKECREFPKTVCTEDPIQVRTNPAPFTLFISGEKENPKEDLQGDPD